MIAWSVLNYCREQLTEWNYLCKLIKIQSIMIHIEDIDIETFRNTLWGIGFIVNEGGDGKQIQLILDYGLLPYEIIMS